MTDYKAAVAKINELLDQYKTHGVVAEIEEVLPSILFDMDEMSMVCMLRGIVREIEKAIDSANMDKEN